MKKQTVFLALACVIFLSITRGAWGCKGSQVLYEDNFATLDPAWGTPGPNLSFKDSKLILQADVNTGFVALNKANLFNDVDACVSVTMAKSDDPNFGGGLVFWAKDSNNYYAVLVSGGGQVSVRRYVNNNSSAFVDWSENPAVKKGIGQINQLRVVTSGNQATVYVNDTQVATFTGQPPDGGSFIGVKCSSAEKSQIVWEFSNLKITKPVTSVATVMSTPVATGPSGCKGQVIYGDNFATLDPAWGVQGPNLSVGNNRMVIQPETNTSFVALNKANLFQDMDACVNVTLVKTDDPNYSAGLIFWAKDSNDYYYLLVAGNGFFAVEHWLSNRLLTPVDWRESAAIRKGIGQTNQLEVITNGNQATVYINATETITFKGQPPQGGSFIGMIALSPEKAQNKNVWEFSDLKITKP